MTGAFHESGHALAAHVYGVPITAVTIADDRPHLHRDCYRAHDPSFGLEALVTLCLAGPEAEKEFCGLADDEGDRLDYETARKYSARQISNPLQAAAALARYRDAAARLVRSPWGRQRITVIADALLRHGTLTGEEIAGLIDCSVGRNYFGRDENAAELPPSFSSISSVSIPCGRSRGSS